MTSIKKILGAVALVAVSSTAVLAQSDFGSPMGAGAGLGGSISPYLPLRGASGGAIATTPAVSALANAGSGGATVENPAGGTVNVPQAVAQGIAAMLAGDATPAQVASVQGALGVTGPAASSLISMLQGMGSGRSGVALIRATAAYNAAIMAGSGTPTPAMLAIRSALASMAGSR